MFSPLILVEEIQQFTQKNLISEDIMLLDANESLYIWIGNLSSKEDQKLCLQLAIDYLQMGKKMNKLLYNIFSISMYF